MLDHLVGSAKGRALPLWPIAKKDLERELAGRPAHVRRWAEELGFEAKPGEICPIPGKDGFIAGALIGVGRGPWAWAAAARKLPKGTWRVDGELEAGEADDAALAWALGCYEFTRYKKSERQLPGLVWPEGADRPRVRRLATAVGMVRDLVNTPAGDMGPPELAAAAKKLARAHGAKIRVVVGDELLEENYPAIHAVGRACAHAPRLIDLRWGKQKHPRLTLVGKGVCFDTGGLDLKTSPHMKLMKKDMGGAAMVLGLAHAIMDAKLPIRLRVLVPAVENSVAGNAYHPLDVLRTRKGLTVEVGNTDAEGRIVLCDALAEADSEDPDLIIDIATLTGAARVALGTDVPAVFATDEESASALLGAGDEIGDPLWRMPLFDDYRKQLESKVADLNNISSSPYGGAITAGLFLREFVSKGRPWIHIDTMAYNLSDRPGRPAGGDAPGMRALFTMLERRYGRPREAQGRGGRGDARGGAERRSGKKARARKTRAAADEAGTHRERRAHEPRGKRRARGRDGERSEAPAKGAAGRPAREGGKAAKGGERGKRGRGAAV